MLNLYPARYRSRFCNSTVRFTDCELFCDPEPSDESPGYFRSSAARTIHGLLGKAPTARNAIAWANGPGTETPDSCSRNAAK
jgi:hypothetical protein